jgi:hypothetical protein
VELDGRVEPADGVEGRAAHGEVATVEDGAGTRDALQREVHGRCDEAVVGPHEPAANEVPVVEPVGAGHRGEAGIPDEPSVDALEPLQGGAAVGVEIDEQVAAGRSPACRPGTDEALRGLVHHDDARDP